MHFKRQIVVWLWCLLFSGAVFDANAISKKKELRVDLSGQKIDQNHTFEHPEAITTLILDSCELVQLPAQIKQLTALKHLSLRYNPNLKLEQTLNALADLEELEFLNLGHNQLTALPPSITKLQHLSGLRLSYNQLQSESTWTHLAQLPELCRLWIDNNELQTFSATWLTFPGLHFLYAYDNQISQINLPATQSAQLWVLHLGTNQFKALPPELTKVRNLRMAMFNQNQIASIPDAFSTEKYSLAALILDANPMLDLQRERARQCFGKMMMYSARSMPNQN